jgi:hypothetical protein
LLTMKLSGHCLLLLSAALCVPARAHTQSRQSAPQNAAVQYRRADKTLRNSYTLPPDAAATLAKALTSPLDDVDQELVKAANEALAQFRHATEIKNCDWELSLEDGPSADTSYRQAVRELVLIAGIRARLRFRHAQAAEAIKDSLAAITAARHLSLDGTLASVLISYQLEEQISQILARNLSRLSRPQLRQLTARLSSLPPGAKMADALRSEQLDRHPLLTVVRGAASRDDLIAHLSQGVPLLTGDQTRAQQVVDGCGSSVQGFDDCLNQQRAFYEVWIARFSEPPAQFESEYNLQLAKSAAANPIIRFFTPALPRLRWAEAYSRTRRTLLLAAIAVQIDGPAALARFNDPYQSDILAYIPLEHGFRLESELADEGGSIGLSIQPESP